MTHAPTAEQFLAMRTTEDDDNDGLGPAWKTDFAPLWADSDALESIADSLRRIAAGMGGESLTADPAQETADDRL